MNGSKALKWDTDEEKWRRSQITRIQEILNSLGDVEEIAREGRAGRLPRPATQYRIHDGLVAIRNIINEKGDSE